MVFRGTYENRCIKCNSIKNYNLYFMKFIAYYRTSEKHGLALHTLRRSVQEHVAQEGGTLIGEYRESVVDLADVGDAFRSAVQRCQRDKAVLVLAESDPLSRQLGLLALLVSQRVPLVAAGQSDVNKVLEPLFTDVRPDISHKVTKSKVKKKPSVRSRRGNPDLGHARENSAAVRAENADAFALKFRHKVLDWRVKGHTLAQIAARLNDMNELGPRGGKWHSTSVSNLISRCECMTDEESEVRDI